MIGGGEAFNYRHADEVFVGVRAEAFADIDGNGQKDPWDPVSKSAFDGKCTYFIRNLPKRAVRVYLPALGLSADVVPSAAASKVSFSFVVPGTKDVLVGLFRDKNGNRTRDANEAPINGFRVDLTVDNIRYRQLTNDENGLFHFDNLYYSGRETITVIELFDHVVGTLSPSEATDAVHWFPVN